MAVSCRKSRVTDHEELGFGVWIVGSQHLFERASSLPLSLVMHLQIYRNLEAVPPPSAFGGQICDWRIDTLSQTGKN